MSGDTVERYLKSREQLWALFGIEEDYRIFPFEDLRGCLWAPTSPVDSLTYWEAEKGPEKGFVWPIASAALEWRVGDYVAVVFDAEFTGRHIGLLRLANERKLLTAAEYIKVQQPGKNEIFH